MMRKKNKSIPVNHFGGPNHPGISIDKMVLPDILNFEGAAQSERHDRHSFHLVEKGKITLEIDFQIYAINAPSVIYMHPNQVHRLIAFEHVVVSSWALDNENLQPDYLKLLEDLTPAKPLLLNKETLSMLAETITLCAKLSARIHDKLYASTLRDSCNALVALVISQYLERAKSADQVARFETVHKAFHTLLDRSYTTLKRPAEYARQLHLSTPYLNECVQAATGHSVSYAIQQRITLEAKRLLHHSDKTVKEIATALGYEDHRYFTRLFTKVTGLSPLAFRHKNLD